MGGGRPSRVPGRERTHDPIRTPRGVLSVWHVVVGGGAPVSSAASDFKHEIASGRHKTHDNEAEDRNRSKVGGKKLCVRVTI